MAIKKSFNIKHGYVATLHILLLLTAPPFFPPIIGPYDKFYPSPSFYNPIPWKPIHTPPPENPKSASSCTKSQKKTKHQQSSSAAFRIRNYTSGAVHPVPWRWHTSPNPATVRRTKRLISSRFTTTAPEQRLCWIIPALVFLSSLWSLRHATLFVFWVVVSFVQCFCC